MLQAYDPVYLAGGSAFEFLVIRVRRCYVRVIPRIVRTERSIRREVVIDLPNDVFLIAQPDRSENKLPGIAVHRSVGNWVERQIRLHALIHGHLRGGSAEGIGTEDAVMGIR